MGRGLCHSARDLDLDPDPDMNGDLDPISASADQSVRLWTLGGEYLGTLGMVLPWPQLVPDLEWDPGDQPARIPADLKRVSSSTTIKVSLTS